MASNLERIIQCVHQGDQDSVQELLDCYNTEYAECFFFNIEEQERRKQQELEEFKKNKVREFVPQSDSDFNSDSEEDDPDLLLRRSLAAALVCFIRRRLQPGLLRVCLRTLRILSRDRQALEPLVTDTGLLTLAHLAGIVSLQACLQQEEEEEIEEEYAETCSDIQRTESSVCEVTSKANANPSAAGTAEANGSGSSVATWAETSSQPCPSTPASTSRGGGTACTITVTVEDPCGNTATADTSDDYYNYRGEGGHGMLARGKKDAREEKSEEEENEEEGEVCRKEAMKALCNVIYNSQRAQEKASRLRLLPGLSKRLALAVESRAPSAGQFYELRLLFLLTSLRPELRLQLQQEGGVAMLTATLEQCLAVRWGEEYVVLCDREAPPVSKEASQRAIEILKTLFNITYSIHRQEPDEEDAALYRHLAAVLRHCLLLSCEAEDLLEELQGHTVNVLLALPLQCLDVLLSVRVDEVSREWEGVNMDCVHTLLVFMEKRLDRGQKLKEKLTPVLNLLTESSRVHRETRHYLRQQILPPLRDVAHRPEQGATLRGRLVRLMTHVDTDIKYCAAELLFVLCKENVGRFVKYTGYGNAAGLLAARGIMSGGRCVTTHSQYSSDSDSDTEEYREAKGRINLVTGRVEEEQPDPMKGMTDEEKEAESRHLIGMFSRLSRDNIIQPVGLTTDGRLAPMCGQMRGCTLEEDEDDEEEEEEEEEEDGEREGKEEGESEEDMDQ
ncbi:chaperone Ric-8A [Polymixia lowei]